MICGQEVAFDIAIHAHKKAGESMAGDQTIARRVPDEERMVLVLADGLGSGVKAGVLAGLTAAMAAHHATARQDLRRFATTLQRTLPVCRVRGIGYSTFTICDLGLDGRLRVANYGNPPVLIVGDDGARPIPMETLQDDGPGRVLEGGEIQLQPGEGLVMCSDGITQAGLGKAGFNFGWGVEKLCAEVTEQGRAPARVLAKRLANRARALDGFAAKDDISCMVARLQKPRELLLMTGPPFDRNRDAEYAAQLDDAPGRVMIAGGTTSEVIANHRETFLDWERPQKGDALPPFAAMDGADLVTEGVLTLTAVQEALTGDEPWNGQGRDQLSRICSELIDADRIRICCGAGINTANHDPRMGPRPLDRRRVMEGLAETLRTRYNKEIDLELW